jgi:hypothetical protein
LGRSDRIGPARENACSSSQIVPQRSMMDFGVRGKAPRETGSWQCSHSLSRVSARYMERNRGLRVLDSGEKQGKGSFAPPMLGGIEDWRRLMPANGTKRGGCGSSSALRCHEPVLPPRDCDIWRAVTRSIALCVISSCITMLASYHVSPDGYDTLAFNPYWQNLPIMPSWP